MADAPTLARKGVSLDVAAFFKRYAALSALIVLLVFNFAVTPAFRELADPQRQSDPGGDDRHRLGRHDAGDRDRRHRPLRRLADGDFRRARAADLPQPVRSRISRDGRRARLCRSGRGRRPVRRVQRLVHHPLPGPADRRHARHVHRRPRHRPGPDQRQSAGVQEPDVSVHRPRAHLRRAVPGHHHAGARRRRRLDVAQHPVWPPDPVGRRQ